MAVTQNHQNQDELEEEHQQAPSFKPIDRIKTKSDVWLPDELWMTILDSSCTFGPDVFGTVMLNLIKNPNVTSSHLFRADILYDSEDKSDDADNGNEHQRIDQRIPGFQLTRTIVRRLIPRNPQLDPPLIQTCHFYTQLNDEEERNLVVYIPHVESVNDIPFYHPAVQRLAFQHTWSSLGNMYTQGTVSISYSLFPNTTLTTKLERTALRLLQTVHKHGQGQLAGYEKRVHLDQIVPQKRYQDTYTRLKAKYGRRLAEQWVEVTDPGKHVFEDIGIAAFLIEVWRDMYCVGGSGDDENGEPDHRTKKPPFPGFVDIGCGNGILVYILLEEGYEGWGFDARERKTWTIFPDHVRAKLECRVLVPEVFQHDSGQINQKQQHNGIFNPGIFIISNHADELTAWTPFLAYLNRSAFIAIPCCSHDLSGSRFRAPASSKASKDEVVRLPQQVKANGGSDSTLQTKQAAETGSLKRTEAQKKMPSAYASLCSYVERLADKVGFEAEREVLRIPSTRNQCIIGRKRRTVDRDGDSVNDALVRRQKVIDIVERELGRSLDAVAQEWTFRAEKLAKKPGSGH